jgi:hypothetical protein
MPTRDRFLALAGAYNFRDLGGYPTADGLVTRWRRLFRSDALHHMSEGDIVLLREVGLAEVIDLRTSSEEERTGRGLLRAEPIGYRNLSVTHIEGVRVRPSRPTSRLSSPSATSGIWTWAA